MATVSLPGGDQEITDPVLLAYYASEGFLIDGEAALPERPSAEEEPSGLGVFNGGPQPQEEIDAALASSLRQEPVEQPDGSDSPSPEPEQAPRRHRAT